MYESKKKSNKRKFIFASVVLVFILMCGIIGKFLNVDKTPITKNELKKESDSNENNTKKHYVKENTEEKVDNKKDEVKNAEEDKKDEVKNTEKDKKDEIKKYKIGDGVHVGNFLYGVHDISFKKTIGNEFMNKTADGIFLLINLYIMNVSKETRTLDNSMFKLIDDNGVEFETSSELTTYLEFNGYKSMFLKKCQPEIKTSGILGFEVPDNKRNYNLKVSGGFWSGDTEMILLQK